MDLSHFTNVVKADIKDAVTTVEAYPKNLKIYAGILCILVFILIGLTIGKYNISSSDRAAISNINNELSKNKTDYQQIVKKDDAQINDNQKQLDNSVKKYQSYKQKESKINDDIKKIQSPKNMQELRSRFASLGYKPI